MKRRFLSDRGAAMVEFAIIAPLLLLVVFGIIEFGRAYNAQNSLTHAAREGAREYAITQDAVAGETTALAAATSLDSTQITVTLSACVPGDPATVTLEYPFQLQIAFFPVSNFTMQSQGVMRCGG
ncbi:MAG: pilus assembly protein [Acidimicrobiia bacterium]|nr:pilus assembly protein [Acidimicrobiia bacterium]MBT8246950.1 pilus assembly protein [Acidimicrobiia bacterium]NNJ46778.1 pilus assembly protein [Acidimicrobiia bacterium]NNL99044.1 pilus assembly protein [Acidimicrobiia bacterium]